MRDESFQKIGQAAKAAAVVAAVVVVLGVSLRAPQLLQPSRASRARVFPSSVGRPRPVSDAGVSQRRPLTGASGPETGRRPRPAPIA